jgi:hypothetical protein
MHIAASNSPHKDLNAPARHQTCSTHPNKHATYCTTRISCARTAPLQVASKHAEQLSYMHQTQQPTRCDLHAVLAAQTRARQITQHHECGFRPDKQGYNSIELRVNTAAKQPRITIPSSPCISTHMRSQTESQQACQILLPPLWCGSR